VRFKADDDQILRTAQLRNRRWIIAGRHGDRGIRGTRVIPICLDQRLGTLNDPQACVLDRGQMVSPRDDRNSVARLGQPVGH
jgi:hypothetical protein